MFPQTAGLPEALAALANGNSCSCAAGIIGRVPGHWAAELLLNINGPAGSGCGAAFHADTQGALNRERIMRSW
ncbi:hypothetical protein [Diplocloster hominis]|uniref:hypothetical protein n=1 Tax=Diplocloster hominis TaxID=3079010 RepID=UPI0031BB50CC